MEKKTLNITYYRSNSIPFSFFVKGNLEGCKLRFCVNYNEEMTAQRIFTVSSENYDGVPGELLAEYDEERQRTKITITPNREYTRTVQKGIYFLSLSAINSNGEYSTIASGSFALLPEGENEFNGFPDEPSYEKYQKVSLEGSKNDSMLFINDSKIVIRDLEYIKNFFNLYSLDMIDKTNECFDLFNPSGAECLSLDENRQFVNSSEKNSWNSAVAVKHEHGNKNILDLTTAIYDIITAQKVENIEPEANKYVHPASHSADMIDESADKKFLSENQKYELMLHFAINEVFDIYNVSGV